MKLKPYEPQESCMYRRLGVIDEKVIFPDKYCKEVMDIVNSSDFKQCIEQYDNLDLMVKALSFIFQKYHIEFHVEHLPKGLDTITPLGFNGAGTYSDQYNTIFIVVNPHILKSKQSPDAFKMMKSALCKLIKHEIIHRVQKTNVHNQKMKSKIYDNSKKVPAEYYAGKYEIMAYAYTIIQDLRLLGNYDDEEILQSLRSNKAKDLIQIGDYSYTFRMYTKLFDLESDVVKKLYKYIFQYLTED